MGRDPLVQVGVGVEVGGSNNSFVSHHVGAENAAWVFCQGSKPSQLLDPVSNPKVIVSYRENKETVTGRDRDREKSRNLRSVERCINMTTRGLLITLLGNSNKLLVSSWKEAMVQDRTECLLGFQRNG